MGSKIQSSDVSRRNFLRKAVYIAPSILTLQALPKLAMAGSLKISSIKSGGTSDGCKGKSKFDDLKTSAKHPDDAMRGEFGCTEIKSIKDIKKALF